MTRSTTASRESRRFATRRTVDRSTPANGARVASGTAASQAAAQISRLRAAPRVRSAGAGVRVSALTAATGYTIAGDTLTIETSEGALTFERVTGA
jgi:hypothetical protein